MDRGWWFWGGNGGGPWRGRRLTAAFFELKAADRIGWWYWAFLAAAVAMPWPMFGWPIPERAVPIFWLLVGGGLLAAARIARVSWPFALLVVWAGVRGAYHAFPLRTLQVLALVLMAGLLYAAARGMPDRWARIAAWTLLVGVAWEWSLGLINAFGYYPFMVWVHPDHISKPMAMLTHPNYWGSYMALSLPIVWALLGVPAAALVFLLTLKTISGGPVISAAAAALVMAWPFFGRRLRWLVAGTGAASIIGVMTLHEWRLSGRWEVWALSLKELMVWPVLGQGLGQWRTWAEDWNRANYLPPAGKNFFVTLQAHSEPLQLWFELGLIGVVLAGLWALQAFLAARQVWRAAPAALIPSPCWTRGRVPLGWVWLAVLTMLMMLVGLIPRPWSAWIPVLVVLVALAALAALIPRPWWVWGRAPLERAWVAVLAAAVVNSLGSPTFHLPGQAAITLLALARVQADAEALTSLPGQATAVPRRRRKERRHDVLA